MSVFFMLIHQFITIRNFHIIDQAPKSSILSLGTWIIDNKFERILRYLIFIMLPCLTGEIIYLGLVSSESIYIVNKILKFINISWLPNFYILVAAIITLFMCLWALSGL